MTHLSHYLLFFSCLYLLLCVSNAGSRPVHGPVYTKPSPFSPEAYDFFHPKSSLPDNPPINSPSSSSPSPSPLPSKTSNVEADSQGSKVSSDEYTTESRKEEGRGGTIGVVLGLSFAGFLSLAIFFVIKKRRANMIRTIVIQSDA